MIMTDDHRFDARRARCTVPPAVCPLTPQEAREFAFELLAFAEQAERIAARSRYQSARPASAARRARAAAATAAAALRSPGGTGGPRDRQLAALGGGRGAARAARRGGPGPRPRHDHSPPALLGATRRQDLRRLGGEGFGDPQTHPAGAAHAGMDRPWRGLGRVVPPRTGKSHFIEALGHRARSTRRARPLRGTRARDSPPCFIPPRRQRQQGRQQADPLRPDHDR